MMKVLMTLSVLCFLGVGNVFGGYSSTIDGPGQLVDRIFVYQNGSGYDELMFRFVGNSTWITYKSSTTELDAQGKAFLGMLLSAQTAGHGVVLYYPDDTIMNFTQVLIIAR